MMVLLSFRMFSRELADVPGLSLKLAKNLSSFVLNLRTVFFVGLGSGTSSLRCLGRRLYIVGPTKKKLDARALLTQVTLDTGYFGGIMIPLLEL